MSELVSTAILRAKDRRLMRKLRLAGIDLRPKLNFRYHLRNYPRATLGNYILDSPDKSG